MSTSAICRQTRFIDLGGHYTLPRPTSVGAGQARHLWFQRWAAGQRVSIASPEVWQREADQFGGLVLREHEDGTFSVVPLADSGSNKG